MSAEPSAPCPGCGLVVPGGGDGCRTLYQDVTLRMLGDPVDHTIPEVTVAAQLDRDRQR